MKITGRESIRNMILSGVFIAIGVVLPLAFHAIPNGGTIFSPMALPILIAAFFMPWQYTLVIGAATPVISSLLTGMPPMMPLPMTVMMAFEFATYGLIISLLKKKLVNDNKLYTTYFALIPAQILGRIVSGLVLLVAIQLFGYKGPSMGVFIWGAILIGLPGIGLQLIVVPFVYRGLLKRFPNFSE